MLFTTYFIIEILVDILNYIFCFSIYIYIYILLLQQGKNQSHFHFCKGFLSNNYKNEYIFLSLNMAVLSKFDKHTM